MRDAVSLNDALTEALGKLTHARGSSAAILTNRGLIFYFFEEELHTYSFFTPLLWVTVIRCRG